jgi:hypothetical protein
MHLVIQLVPVCHVDFFVAGIGFSIRHRCVTHLYRRLKFSMMNKPWISTYTTVSLFNSSLNTIQIL